MEKARWNSINKKQNGLEQSKNKKSSTILHMKNSETAVNTKGSGSYSMD